MTVRILSALVNGALLGTVLTAVVWLVLSLAPRRLLNAATRCAVWWAVLTLIVLLPVAYVPAAPEAPASIAPASSAVISPVEISREPVELNPIATAAASRQGPHFPVEIAAGAWPKRILMLWAAIALLMLIRLAISCALLERRKAHAFAPPVELGASLGEWLTICGTRRRITLAVSSEIATPLAAGPHRPSILIPSSLLTELTGPELEQIGLHETAHLARRDDCVLLLQRIIEALFALHPLVRFIARHIDLEREIACDDFVVEATGRARNYAVCLTRIVELSGGVRGSLAAAAATEERSHLARRIEMLLDRTRHTGTRLLKVRLTAILAALAVLSCMAVRAPGLIAFAIPQDAVSWQVSDPPQPPVPPAAPELPMPPSPPEPPPAPPAQSASVDQYDWHSRNGLDARDIQIHGHIEFTDDEADVKSVAPGGWFSYEESHGFTSRRYQVLGDASMTRRYTVDGREHPLDGEAKAWLRASIPQMLRDTGIDAEGRVRRILKQGGAAAVLAEIAKIQNSGAERRYIQELVTIGNLNTEQFQAVLRTVRGIASDGDKSSMLVFLARFTLKDDLRDYVFDAVSTIGSSGDRRRALAEMARQDPSAATLAAVAKSTQGIDSDGDKASLLVELARLYHDDQAMRKPFFRAIESINSSGEKARVLVAVIENAGDHRDTLVDALRAAAGIPSDGDKNRVLLEAARHWIDDEGVRRVYFDAANAVNSSSDHARALIAVVSRTGLSPASLIEAVRSADRIPSDSDKTSVLSLVVRRSDTPGEVLVAAVQSAARINSDGDKARILAEAAERSSGKPAVRTEIHTAARTLHSDGEYRRVMSVMER